MWGEVDNGLDRKWSGRVWLNPPYKRGLVDRFMSKMAAHRDGLALVFARTDVEWFTQNVWGKATAITFFDGRLYFHHSDGSRAAANAGAGSVLIAYGDQCADILQRADDKIRGQFLDLRKLSAA